MAEARFQTIELQGDEDQVVMMQEQPEPVANASDSQTAQNEMGSKSNMSQVEIDIPMLQGKAAVPGKGQIVIVSEVGQFNLHNGRYAKSKENSRSSTGRKVSPSQLDKEFLRQFEHVDGGIFDQQARRKQRLASVNRSLNFSANKTPAGGGVLGRLAEVSLNAQAADHRQFGAKNFETLPVGVHARSRARNLAGKSLDYSYFIQQAQNNNLQRAERMMSSYILGKNNTATVPGRDTQQRNRTIRSSFVPAGQMTRFLSNNPRHSPGKSTVELDPNVGPKARINVPKKLVLYQLSKNIDEWQETQQEMARNGQNMVIQPPIIPGLRSFSQNVNSVANYQANKSLADFLEEHEPNARNEMEHALMQKGSENHIGPG